MGTYTGTARNDTITPDTVSAGVTRVPAGSKPSAAADTINGLGGNDSINGGGGADTINGGDGIDSVYDQAPTDANGFALSANTGNFIHGNAGDDAIHITIGDSGETNPVTNTAWGDDGDDDVAVRYGSEPKEWVGEATGTITLHGGTGDDLVRVYSYDEVIDLSGTTVHLFGEEGDDVLLASVTNFFGDERGGNNPDFLEGGPGIDRYIVYETQDHVIERAGEGYDRITACQTDYTLPANVEALEIFTNHPQEYAFTGTGNDLDNLITISQSSNDAVDYTLNGAGGDDLIYGSDWGNDTISGGTGNDLLYGSDGDYYQQTDQDTIRGGTGNDLIYGGGGDSDTWDGNDILYGGDGNDRIFGSFGNDRMYGGAGNDELGGQAGNDTMYGGAGNDTLGGGTGNDTLYGDADADVLSGREGLDRLTGGTGNDIFQYWNTVDSRPGAANRDVILGFDGVGAGPGDRIDLSTIDANTSAGGNQAFVFRGTWAFTGAGQIRVVASGADTLIQANTGGSLAPELEILVKDGAATPGQWVPGDFIL